MPKGRTEQVVQETWVAEVKQHLEAGDSHYWEAARIMAEKNAEGVTTKEIGLQVGFSSSIVARYIKVWKAHGTDQSRLSFTEARAEMDPTAYNAQVKTGEAVANDPGRLTQDQIKTLVGNLESDQVQVAWDAMIDRRIGLRNEPNSEPIISGKLADGTTFRAEKERAEEDAAPSQDRVYAAVDHWLIDVLTEPRIGGDPVLLATRASKLADIDPERFSVRRAYQAATAQMDFWVALVNEFQRRGVKA